MPLATDLLASSNAPASSRVGFPRLRDSLAVARIQFIRNARIWAYFKVNAALQLVQALSQLAIFLFLGELVAPDRFSSMAGGSYTSYLVIGMVLLQVLDKSLIGPFTSLSGAYWSTRLESLMLSPHPLGLIIVTDTFWYYTMTTINAVAILGLGTLFGARFGAPESFAMLLLVLVLGAISVFGLGMISASTFSLLNAKGRNEPVTWAVHVLQGLACGLYFPFQMLPWSLKALGLLLPHTYAIDAVRRLLIEDYTVEATLPVQNLVAADPLSADCLFLVLSLVIYLPLGLVLFRRGILKSKRVGNLSRWN
jgi:ABC-2 type transport system permease protein